MSARPTTHRASGQARREALLEAALAVIAEQGIAGATHRAIAQRAGMPLSTTSYFFGSLDDLLAAALHVVADRMVLRAEAQVQQVLAARLGPEESLDLFVDLIFAAPEQDVIAQFEIYLECGRRPALQASAHHILASAERTVEAALRALDIDHAAERAPMVVAMLDGLALHRRAWPRPEADRRALAHALVTLARGFLATDAATRSSDSGHMSGL